MSKAMSALFAADLVPAADIVVPNAFELSVLTDRPVDDIAGALVAADRLRARGPASVVVTSLPGSEAASLATLAVDGDEAWVVETPRLETPAKGAGDVFTALYLGHRLNGRGTASAVAAAVSSVYAVLAKTAAAGADELLLVAAQEDLAAAEQRFASSRLR